MSSSAQNVHVVAGWFADAIALRLHGVRAVVAMVAVLASIVVVDLIDLNTGRPYNFSIAYVLPTAGRP